MKRLVKSTPRVLHPLDRITFFGAGEWRFFGTYFKEYSEVFFWYVEVCYFFTSINMVQYELHCSVDDDVGVNS